MARLTFHGAAGTVTGSKYLLEAGRSRVLVDCGLFQGLKELRLRNWAPTPFDADSLDSVVLTHAHLDHVGYLPRVVKQGYHKPVYCTPATKELAEIILLDSAKCQEYDAQYANKKGFSKHEPALPLYDGRDVEQTMRLFRTVERDEWFSPAESVRMRYHDAGHLLGSTMIEVEVTEGKSPLRILFSGDVGRYDGPLYHDPSPPPPCDYLICESTYGDRDHPESSILDGLEAVIHRGVKRGGVMLMAAFAVGRAQQLIYLMQGLKSQHRIPDIPIFLDSPMACDATAVYREFSADHDLSEGVLDGAHPALGGPMVKLARSTAESKAINAVHGPAVILASSGMMTGGRIVHHLFQRLSDPRNTIVLGGYMAEGTRGRLIQDGAEFLRMFGHEVPIRAAVEKVPGLSGHADRSGLLRWLGHIGEPPKRTFLTHGEPPAASSLADEIRRVHRWDVVIPKMGDSAELS
jgi:metallo-beta-lactamase family protein